MPTRKRFNSALNKLALNGNVTALADAYSDAAIPQDKQDIEPSLIAGIKICERDGRVADIARLLKRTGLSDTVRRQIEPSLVTGIKVCERDGRVDDIAHLLERTGLSDTVMIAGIEVCGRKGLVDAVARLLGRVGLSDTVKQQIEPSLIAGIKACGRKGWVGDVARLLERTDLSDKVRQAAQLAISQARVSATDIVTKYINRNPLAGDGTMSAGTVRGPRGIAPAGSKSGKVTV